MNHFGAVILVITAAIILFHITSIDHSTPDQILAYYFILIGIADIYLNHIHDRFLNI